MNLTLIKKIIKLMMIQKPNKRRSLMNSLKMFTILIPLLGAATIVCGQQAEKTLVKSFNLKGKQVLLLDLEGDVEVQHWKSETLRVEMSIGIEKGSNAMLKSLITAGRYNLRSQVEEDVLKVYAPGMERDVKIKGSKLDEKITFIVNVPEDIIVKMGDEASSNASTESKISDSL